MMFIKVHKKEKREKKKIELLESVHLFDILFRLFFIVAVLLSYSVNCQFRVD